MQGPSNPFLAGNEGTTNQGPAPPARPELPAGECCPRRPSLPRLAAAAPAPAESCPRPYEQQIQDYTIISGTPDTVIPKIRHVLETIRPGSIFFWDGDGAMTHDDAMRSLRLMGQEVLPAVREIADELELPGPFEIDPATSKPYEAQTNGPAPVAAGETAANA